jgi:hypothetical protein
MKTVQMSIYKFLGTDQLQAQCFYTQQKTWSLRVFAHRLDICIIPPRRFKNIHLVYARVLWCKLIHFNNLWHNSNSIY